MVLLEARTSMPAAARALPGRALLCVVVPRISMLLAAFVT